MRAIASAMVVVSCTGCGLVQYHLPSPTVIHLSPAPEAVGLGGKPVDFGIRDVLWDTLQSGYGLAGWGTFPRDHEGYWHLSNYYIPSPPGEERRILITPVRPPGRATCVYKLQMIVGHGLLEKAGGTPGRDEMLEGTLLVKPYHIGSQLAFDLLDVPVSAHPPGRGRYTLSGRIVAKAGDLATFESLVGQFNEDKLTVEAQK